MTLMNGSTVRTVEASRHDAYAMTACSAVLMLPSSYLDKVLTM
jgi:hypothetical protein